MSALRWIWNAGLVLWVCRVPLASTALAAALLVLTPQGRDLFADIALAWWYWALFLLLCFCWAWIVHGSARHALQCDDWVPETHAPGGLGADRRVELRAEFGLMALWVPRVLGLSVLLLVGWGLCKTWRNMDGASAALGEAAAAEQISLILLLVLLFVIGLFCFLVLRRRTLIVTGTQVCLDGRTPIFAKWFGPVPPPRPLTAADLFIAVARWFILFLVIVAIWFPLFAAGWTPRLFFVPLLFSGIVLFLGEIASWSHRVRTPLLLIVVAASVFFINIAERYHDVRWLKGSPAAASEPRQIPFKLAVDRWMTANDCSGAAAKCPRPILIAGAGGASRAAFLTATVVGALLDLDNAPDRRAEEIGHVRSRIFAMSTVSGSSVGAAVIRAAMVDALGSTKPESPPCKDGGTGSWYGVWAEQHSPNTHFNVSTSWRDCFQAILAGDFLSPVLIGIFYRDNFPIANVFTGNALWGDRAQLLEQAFEARHNRMTVGGRSVTCRDFAEYQQAKNGEESGLCRRFGYHPDVDAQSDAWKRWVPLLFLNATSVETGRRVIISDVRIGSEYIEGKTLLPFAYDLWELRDDQTRSLPDIRLSTAAGLSARFPVISPYGAVRDSRDHDIVDQLVDGGYFENDGLATVADVAQALKDYQLQPVVIRVVNDPKPLHDDRQLAPGRPPRPHNDGRTPFEGVASIFRALTATRSGHEDGHEAYLKQVLGQNDERIYPINVYHLSPDKLTNPKLDDNSAKSRLTSGLCRSRVNQSGYMEFVSMSWWMSQPVQAYLDAQLCIGANLDRLVCELQHGQSADGALCKSSQAEIAARRSVE
jgi:hypothetical protein